jgi:hypothetical protein
VKLTMTRQTEKIEPSVVQRNPNAFMGLSTATLTALLIYEADHRFGIDLTEVEATFLVGIVTSVVLFIGKRIPGGE